MKKYVDAMIDNFYNKDKSINSIALNERLYKSIEHLIDDGVYRGYIIERI